MSKKEAMIYFENCDKCPHFDDEYYDYAHRCKKLQRVITEQDAWHNYVIPDDCPLEDKKPVELSFIIRGMLDSVPEMKADDWIEVRIDWRNDPYKHHVKKKCHYEHRHKAIEDMRQSNVIPRNSSSESWIKL